jgi:hypothetical protein
MELKQAACNVQEDICEAEWKGCLIVRIILDFFCVGLIYSYIYVHGSRTLKSTPGGVEVFAFSVYGIKTHLILFKHIVQLFGYKNNQNGSIRSQMLDSFILASTVALSLFFNDL